MPSVEKGLHTKVSPWVLPEVDRSSRNPENWPMEVDLDQAAVVNAARGGANDTGFSQTATPVSTDVLNKEFSAGNGHQHWGGKNAAYPPTICQETFMDNNYKRGKQCRQFSETSRLEGLLNDTGKEAALGSRTSPTINKASWIKICRHKMPCGQWEEQLENEDRPET